MLNHIVIMGRMTRDPELRHTASDLAVASFSLAVDRDYKAKDSQERETDFINCVAWRTTAEYTSKYFGKGRMTIVSGRLQVRGYTDKDGNKRTATEVLVENIYPGDYSKPGGAAAGDSPGAAATVTGTYDPDAGLRGMDDDEDNWRLPF